MAKEFDEEKYRTGKKDAGRPQDLGAWKKPHVIELLSIVLPLLFTTLYILILDLYFRHKVMERREENFTIPNFDTDEVASSQTCSTSKRKKKTSNSINKRRFSDEQIRSLESIFCSSDSKLDSRKKMQLATELGLQPRQIAIWFQNRRARCKSKQMENDFRSLKDNYDYLASQFKTLQEEKNTLHSQYQKLSELVREGYHEGYCSHDIRKTTCESSRTKSLAR